MYVIFYGYGHNKNPRWEAVLGLGEQEPSDPDDKRVRKFEKEADAVDFQEKNYHIAPEFWRVMDEIEAREVYKSSRD